MELAVQNVCKATWSVSDLELVCRSLKDYVQRGACKAKRLTGAQARLLAYLRERIKSRDGKRRFGIQAPSGSGKSLLCVKLAAKLVTDKLVSIIHPGCFKEEAPARPEASLNVLLLSHSVAMVRVTRDELMVDLGQRVNIGLGMDVCFEALGDVAAGHGYRVHTMSQRYIEIHVMTIDGLVERQLRKPSRQEHRRPKYDVAVVDEGHHVFSHQKYKWLDGQHNVDAAQVRDVLEAVLNNPHGTAAVVFFHDTRYQLISAQPVYPLNCEMTTQPLPIVRNPGPVRDLSLPFSTQLQTDRLQPDGKAGFISLIDEVAGAAQPPRRQQCAVRMVNVERDSALSDRYDNNWAFAMQLVNADFKLQGLRNCA